MADKQPQIAKGAKALALTGTYSKVVLPFAWRWEEQTGLSCFLPVGSSVWKRGGIRSLGGGAEIERPERRQTDASVCV